MSNAFLHGILEDKVYMRQPSGFKSSTHQDHVCRMKKAIYGLRQSPSAWFQRLRDFLVAIGFKESLGDQSLFIFTNNDVTVYFLVYVDDSILTTSSNKFIDSVIIKLGNEFVLKDCGNLSFFLGIQFTKLGNGDILTTQQQYFASLLETLGLENLKPMDTPMEERLQFSDSDVLDEKGQWRFRQTVGSLQYLTTTRPDISYAINKMSQHMSKPIAAHWFALQRIIRYLCSTLNMGLRIK